MKPLSIKGTNKSLIKNMLRIKHIRKRIISNYEHCKLIVKENSSSSKSIIICIKTNAITTRRNICTMCVTKTWREQVNNNRWLKSKQTYAMRTGRIVLHTTLMAIIIGIIKTFRYHLRLLVTHKQYTQKDHIQQNIWYK